MTKYLEGKALRFTEAVKKYNPWIVGNCSKKLLTSKSTGRKYMMYLVSDLEQMKIDMYGVKA